MAVLARRLSDRLLRQADRDFSSLLARARWTGDERSGVRVALVDTKSIGEDLLSALLVWRLAQYLLTGFYDEARVRELGWTSEPRDSVHESDLHGLALDGRGRLLVERGRRNRRSRSWRRSLFRRRRPTTTLT